MNYLNHQNAPDPRRIEHLRSEINVEQEKINGFIRNNVHPNNIDQLVVSYQAHLMELANLERSKPFRERTRIEGYKWILRASLFLLPHTDAERPMRADMINFTQDAFREAYPNFSYSDLAYKNKLFQWLRKEGLGYREPSSRYSDYEPNFPITSEELEEFYAQQRENIFSSMINDINPGNLFPDPFENNMEGIEYFSYYNDFLQYSPMKRSADDPIQPPTLSS